MTDNNAKATRADALVAGRAVYIKQLWEPSTEDLDGKPRAKPVWQITLIVPKSMGVQGPSSPIESTVKYFSADPSMRSLSDAVGAVYKADFAKTGHKLEHLTTTVRDGDLPTKTGKTYPWAAGHWVIAADTTLGAPQVFMMDGNTEIQLQAPTLGGRAVVKDGDHVLASLNVAKRSGASGSSTPGFKLYLGSVIFTASGDHIAVGHSGPSANDMMAAARKQGLGNLSGY